MKRRYSYNKFRVAPKAARTVDGVVFASKREAMRYSELKLLEQHGIIRTLTLQPRLPIIVNGQRVCVYVADFAYFERGKRIIEDSKGVKTQVYKLKRKLVKACYGFDIRES